MARGRWLKKMAAKAKDRIEDVQELLDTVDGESNGNSNSLLSSATSSFASLTSNVDMGPAVATIQARGADCHKVAAETMELCESTQQKSQQMVDFGSEIQSTLQGFGNSMDASALETIRDLTDGAKLKQAMEIAKDMDVSRSRAEIATNTRTIFVYGVLTGFSIQLQLSLRLLHWDASISQSR